MSKYMDNAVTLVVYLISRHVLLNIH